MQKEIADGIGVEPGLLIIMSGSGQIYRHYYQQVEGMLGKFRKHEDKFDDPRGNFVVEVKDGKIIAKLVHPETGNDLADHMERALWMGGMPELDVSVFETAKG